MDTCRLAASVVAVVMAATTRAGEIKLTGETVLMEVDERMYGVPYGRPWTVRLSPDGEHLLFARRAVGTKPAADGADPDAPARGGYQVVLRHGETGKEKLVPIPLLTDVGDVLITAIAMNPFSPDGKRLVVPAGVDADGDGVWSVRQEKLQPAVYDIASGKLTRIGVEGDRTIATFDAPGKHVIFVVLASTRPLSGKMYAAPADTLKPKALKTWGLPRTPRPTDNTLALAEVILLPDRRRPLPKLVLYDYVKDTSAAQLPIHEQNTSLDDFTPQWTADGRYLYYVDLEMEPPGDEARPRRKQFTRVWDVQQGKEAARLPDFVAIGPCGGATTMVLTKGDGGLFLHDAATGRERILPDLRQLRPISTTGTWLLYLREQPDGKRPLCRAEIQAGDG